MTSIASAIINTLCYADIFTYPLTSPEIHHYLIHSQKTPRTSTRLSLNRLVKQRKIIKQGKYYCLPGRAHLISLRLQRQRASQHKKALAQKIGDRLKIIPTLQAIYLTGALAMDNATISDDIDLMLITSPNRLWTTRALVNTTLDLFRLRRTPAKPNEDPALQNQADYNNKLCLNLWLDTTSLSVPKAHHNLYTAHEVAQAKPLWDRGDTQYQFIHQNRWITHFLANIPNPRANRQTKQVALTQTPGIIETQAYRLQRRLMQAKQTRETITPHLAFFHPRDTGRWVITRYHQRLHKFSQ